MHVIFKPRAYVTLIKILFIKKTKKYIPLVHLIDALNNVCFGNMEKDLCSKIFIVQMFVRVKDCQLLKPKYSSLAERLNHRTIDMKRDISLYGDMKRAVNYIVPLKKARCRRVCKACFHFCILQKCIDIDVLYSHSKLLEIYKSTC